MGNLSFLDGLLPPGLLELSIFAAASSGFFFFGWNKIIHPFFKSIYRTRYHEIDFHVADGIYTNVDIWLDRLRENHYFTRTHKAVDKLDGSYEEEENPDRHIMAPGFGSFLIWTGFGRDAIPPIMVTRTEVEKEGVYENVEKITLRIFTTSRAKVERVFDQIRRSSKGDPSEDVKMFMHGSWSSVGGRKDVPFVVSDCLDECKKDIERFLSIDNRRFHAERSIPYRRGYLLSGPPGTGKSNFVAHISREYGLPIYAVADAFNAKELIRMFKSMHGPAIFLLEDIDLSKYGAKREHTRKSIEVAGMEMNATTVGEDEDGAQNDLVEKVATDASNMLRMFLNSLDGIVKSENFIFVCTTNRKDSLDDALLRPGRIDVVVDMELLTAAEQFRYYNRFYGLDAQVEDVEPRSVADVSNIFVTYARDPERALEELRRTTAS